MSIRIAVVAIFSVLLVFGSFAGPPEETGEVRLDQGAFPITINDRGVLVGIPPQGIATVDGPRVDLVDDFAEWFGVAFTGSSGRVEGVGAGRAPDWSQRPAAKPMELYSDGARATATLRMADLEIETEFSFDSLAPYLLARVTLTNLGNETLTDIVYTREWSQSSPVTGSGWTFPEDMGGLIPAPDDICRVAWMTDDLEPGESAGLRFSYQLRSSSPAADDDVNLSLWTDPTYPSGLPIGDTYGISWGDYDADGFIDLFALKSGKLWRNLGGASWALAADLDTILPRADFRYGSSFGDYNNDGLPDIATEPRKDYDHDGDDTLFHLLENLGGGPNFSDVAGLPAIVDVQPFGDSETLAWGDVNCDGNLDLFVPVYPSWAAGPGNFFLFNLGATGPGGAYRFAEMSATVGLDNPPGTSRPEGAQFVDLDYDGDMDLYSNGTLYRNVSTLTTPAFEALSSGASGIGLAGALDEGAMLVDYDLDGDYDLLAVYDHDGVRIWEAYGDGTYFPAELTVVESPFIGLGLGMSGEDWDNDGDTDFTTREIFRRNMLVETGQRIFRVASHTVPAEHLTSATPAWADWDRDGDLDCALGNWGDEGHLYENTLYTAATPDANRRHLRVRAVGNSQTVAAGLENQYATSVEVHLLNGPDDYRRKKFVASGHGYLNQNDYTLQFGLPADSDPGDPSEDLHFDLTIDYPNIPADGLWRVDKHVNPVLGDVNLADLTDREIKVFRCGEVSIDGVLHEPYPLAVSGLTTTTGGLAAPTTTQPLPVPTIAVGPDAYVGLSFNTLQATGNLRLREIILDGTLADATPGCPSDGHNLALWDVTDPQAPTIVVGSTLNRTTSSRNRRNSFRTEVVLEPGRLYRLVAHVAAYRATTIAAPVDHGPVEVTGGLLYEDLSACDGQAVVGATETSEVHLALRFAPGGTVLEQHEPTGDTLRLGKTSMTTLEWIDLPTSSGFEVLRCDASSGPCVPTPHATTPVSSYSETPGPQEMLWYRIRTLADCPSH